MSKRKANKNYQRRENIKSSAIALVTIAVEGEKTEPNYFEMLQEEYQNKIKLEIIPSSKGKSAPKHILSNLIEFKNKHNIDKEDSCWIVIDVDRNAKHIPQIIKDANEQSCKVAISNPCFEIWLCLHRGNIKIEGNSVIFYKENDIITKINQQKLTAKEIRKQNILNKINSGFHPTYKDIYFNTSTAAVKKSKELIKNDKPDNFLCEKEHRGKTRVGELIEEIIKKLSNNK